MLNISKIALVPVPKKGIRRWNHLAESLSEDVSFGIETEDISFGIGTEDASFGIGTLSWLSSIRAWKTGPRGA